MGSEILVNRVGTATARGGKDARDIRRASPVDYLRLTKPRITALVVLTAAAGFYMGTSGAVDLVAFAHAMLGVALVAAGTSGVNQVIERDIDALMARTRNRPLPAGRVATIPAAVFSGALAAIGIGYLGLMTNLLTAGLALATVVSYDFMYTPLKRVHSSSTIVGAVPGALPALGGWTAASGAIEAGGLTLFGILFVWQLPHFFTLAWLLRKDYEAAGIRTLSVGDDGARRTRLQTLWFTILLLPVSLSPFFLGIAGRVYCVAAALLGIAFLWLAVRFWGEADRHARRVFKYSVLYLPLLLIVLTLDKT